MKGILFKPWKIVYIAEHPDIEIQTRRGIKPQPDNHTIIYIHDIGAKEKRLAIKPRYQQGETVYVKEAWRTRLAYNNFAPRNIPSYAPIVYKGSNQHILNGRWRSPMMMPQKFARYFITITDVRAERLQEITWADTLSEGISGYTFARGCLSKPPPDARWKFIELWNSINKDYPFESNPWVWVYTFRREK